MMLLIKIVWPVVRIIKKPKVVMNKILISNVVFRAKLANGS